MKNLLLGAAALLLFADSGLACSFESCTPESQLRSAGVVFVGKLLSCESFLSETGTIRTRAILQVSETFKGTTPALLPVSWDGGCLNGFRAVDSFTPKVQIGRTYLTYASKAPKGLVRLAGCNSLYQTDLPQKSAIRVAATPLQALRSLTALTGPLPGDDITDVQIPTRTDRAGQTNDGPTLNTFSAVTNVFTSGDGLSARFVQQDRAEAIRYLLDADALPSGLSLLQAQTAVQQALDAWSNATSLRFQFAGVQSFGRAASQVPPTDGLLRIQLHDLYGEIAGSGDQVGRGGNQWSQQTLASGWTVGGNVKGNDFHRVTGGWVIIQHTNAFVRNVTNLAEVLCHEMGHALSFDHSSNLANEPNPTLKGAMMYFNIHGNGRGAVLDTFDVNVSRQLYPRDNTPPYCFERYIDALTTPDSRKGMTFITFTGYDLQTTNLSLQTTDPASSSGNFSVSGNHIFFDPNGYYNDTPRLDPQGNSAYGRIFARYSDGTNASPYKMVKVLSLTQDNYYEGIPDWWRTTYFGNPNPSAGAGRHANQDYDTDGLTNIQEYQLGTSPAGSGSTFRASIDRGGLIEWTARPYELYEIHQTTNWITWSLAVAPVTPTNSTGSATVGTANTGFYRVVKVQ